MTNGSQPLHPYEIIPESWVMETMTIGNGGLVVRYQFDEPSELFAPALTHHLISVNIGQQGTHQVTRMDKQEYDGVLPTGSLWLATADNISCEWAWETTDEIILFQIDPLYLQQIAAENGCANSERLELKPVVFDRNPRFESITSGRLRQRQKFPRRNAAARFRRQALQRISGQPVHARLAQNLLPRTIATTAGKRRTGRTTAQAGTGLY